MCFCEFCETLAAVIGVPDLFSKRLIVKVYVTFSTVVLN